MAEPLEPVAPAPIAGPVEAAPVAAPVAAAPVSETSVPVATPEPAAPVVAEPVAEPAPIVAPEPVKEAPSILADALSKPAEPAPDAPKAEPSSEAIVLPAYDPFTLPEGVKLDDKGLSQFTNILGDFEATTKADHAVVQALGQKLIDFHLETQKAAADNAARLQRETWEQTNADWQRQFREDPELGGNRTDTTVRQAGAVLERYGALMGADREGALRGALRATGAGNHPEIIRFMKFASEFLVEKARPVAASLPKGPMPKQSGVGRYRSTTVNGAA